MGLIITLKNGGVRYGAVAAPAQIPLPNDVSVLLVRPCFTTKKERTIVTGQYGPGLIIDESLTANRLGVMSPTAAPTLVATGSGAVTGSNTGYLVWAHYVNGKVVARSNLGPPSPPVTITNQLRQWGALPTSAPQSRINMLEAWVSITGALPRFVWAQPPGITTFTEGIPNLNLGSAWPSINGIATYHRYPPPYCLYNVPYRARIWYAGDPAYTYRTWYTPIGELEGVGVATYLDTRDHEAVTGLGPLDDHLVVFGLRVAYAVQGLGITGSDFEIEKISPSVGCVAHASILNVHRRLIFPATDNIYLYDGTFHPLLTGKKETDYIADYKASSSPFHNSQAAVDTEEGLYLLLTPRPLETNKTVIYEASYNDYIPEAGGHGREMEITRAIRARQDNCFVTSTAGSPSVLYVGSEDQFVRLMNVHSNKDDDGDTYGKKITLLSPHFFLGNQSGDELDGKTFQEFWGHLETENVLTTIKVWTGDEAAADGDPDQVLEFGPGALTSRVSKSLWSTILNRSAGRGITVQIEVTQPDADWRYRGFGGNYLPGVSKRGGVETVVGQRS